MAFPFLKMDRPFDAVPTRLRDGVKIGAAERNVEPLQLLLSGLYCSQAGSTLIGCPSTLFPCAANPGQLSLCWIWGSHLF